MSLAFGCGSGSGESQVCQQPLVCGQNQASALEVFSRRGCQYSVESYWCGVNAQRLAECLHQAQVCLESGLTRDQVKAALIASVCAAEFKNWDECFANGEAGDVSFDDDDD